MAKPIKAKVYYIVREKIFQNGDYLVAGKKVRGHRDYYYKSALWLMWHLPKSKNALLKTIQKWSWRSPEVVYDQSKFDFEKRHQDYFADFNEDNQLIDMYEIFNGEERTIVSSLEAESGPDTIKICYDNGKEVSVKVTSKIDTLKRVKKIIQ
jgi:hypothetical protein